MGHRIVRGIVLLVLVLVTAPCGGDAQQRSTIPRIGFIRGFAPPTPDRNLDAFQHGLRDEGYIEGQNVVLEIRYAGFSMERIAPRVAELLRLPVDILVTVSTAATLAAKEATSTTPIVFTSVGHPVELGLVASLARPGGNVTGIAAFAAEIFWVQIELLRQVVPGLTRVAAFANPNNPGYAAAGKVVQAGTPPVGVHFQLLEVRDPTELESTFAAMVREGAEAVRVGMDGMLFQHCRQIVALAAQHRLPAVYGFRACVEAGGLMSYAPHEPARFHRAGVLVGKILQGAKPADLPVEQPIKFELVINLKTAQALGITMPPSLLLLADEVIQ
jgi:putative ABC transport system substrate-binding protein